MLLIEKVSFLLIKSNNELKEDEKVKRKGRFNILWNVNKHTIPLNV